jgi:2-polyprenyl-6-methoxyphenol hydroxylase-like FAD-dependent oxidoreductase
MAEVAVVGGGPVGLGLAIDLALRNVPTVVIERGTTLHRIPKGQNLTQRTGEHFRAWGVTEAIRAATPIPREFGNAGLVTYGQLLSEYSYDWFQRSKVGAYYHALNERLPQYRTEEVLRARAIDLPQITFRTGCRMVGLRTGDNGVTLELETQDGPETLEAPYVIGCDGARSRVRDMSGIAQDMDHQGPRMALLVFRSDALDRVLERFPGKSIFNVMNPAMDGYWQFLGRVDLEGGYFYHAPVPAEAEGEAWFRAHLHQMVGAEFELEFEHIGFWDLRISHAQTYRKGRVFIAGDAAHSHPPYGGYGVNTGFEDARNLSWKLAAKLQGWGSETLLDSYTTERHPVFASVSRDFIGRMIDDFRGFLAAYDPGKNRAAFETAWAARAQGDDTDVTQFLPNYAGSPLVFGPDGAVSGAKGVHAFRAEPGYHLAPQPTPQGDIWDQLSSGFTLMTFTGTAGGFAGAAQDMNVPLKVLALPDPTLRAAYGCDAALVRPDQFVAWTGTADSVDAAAVLRRATGREEML